MQTKDGWQTAEYKTQTVDGPAGFQTETVSNTGLIDESGREWEVEDVVLEKNQFGLVSQLWHSEIKPPSFSSLRASQSQEARTTARGPTFG